MRQWTFNNDYIYDNNYFLSGVEFVQLNTRHVRPISVIYGWWWYVRYVLFCNSLFFWSYKPDFADIWDSIHESVLCWTNQYFDLIVHSIQSYEREISKFYWRMRFNLELPLVFLLVEGNINRIVRELYWFLHQSSPSILH